MLLSVHSGAGVQTVQNCSKSTVPYSSRVVPSDRNQARSSPDCAMSRPQTLNRVVNVSQRERLSKRVRLPATQPGSQPLGARNSGSRAFDSCFFGLSDVGIGASICWPEASLNPIPYRVKP